MILFYENHLVVSTGVDNRCITIIVACILHILKLMKFKYLLFTQVNNR